MDTARDALLDRIEALRAVLPRIEARLDAAQMLALRRELGDWLDRAERARTEGDWTALGRELTALGTRYNFNALLDRELRPSPFESMLGPHRGQDASGREPHTQRSATAPASAFAITSAAPPLVLRSESRGTDGPRRFERLTLSGGDVTNTLSDTKELALDHGAIMVTLRGRLLGSCVMLNACEAGVPGRGLTGHGGWARAFTEAGAAALIAPSWSVTDRAAAGFAARLYRELGAGRTLGAAAWHARAAVRAEGDPDRLAYAVYASPHATLAAGAA